MILAVDVGYPDDKAFVAGILFEDWTDNKPKQEYILDCGAVSAYEPGQFYRRELPCIIKLLDKINPAPEFIIIDGYVYLGKNKAPGLGKYLYDYLHQRVAIIGVAKNPYRHTPVSAEVYRGKSKRPLYVTSVGMRQEQAKIRVQNMYGDARIPFLLQYVDKLTKAKPS